MALMTGTSVKCCVGACATCGVGMIDLFLMSRITTPATAMNDSSPTTGTIKTSSPRSECDVSGGVNDVGPVAQESRFTRCGMRSASAGCGLPKSGVKIGMRSGCFSLMLLMERSDDHGA